MDISPRLRWKLERIGNKLKGVFGGTEEQPRPKLCPACGNLVGATAKSCHQCGASMTYSMAAASRSLARLMPMASPATYAILALSCLLYGISLLWTIRLGGSQAQGGGLFGFGSIDGNVLFRLGESVPLRFGYNVAQPWRFVMAVFLHGSLLHIGMNMYVLMGVGPQLEELYGSARLLFAYVVCGIGGYLLSCGIGGHPSIGGSGAIVGLIGMLLAISMGSQSIQMRMMRNNILIWLVILVIQGIAISVIDNYAHFGGLATGFLLGKILMDRPPQTAEERKRAFSMGWAAGIVVVGSVAAMIFWNLRAS